MNLMQLPDEYQNDLQGRDGRCYYHEVLLFQGKEEWKKREKDEKERENKERKRDFIKD